MAKKFVGREDIIIEEGFFRGKPKKNAKPTEKKPTPKKESAKKK